MKCIILELNILRLLYFGGINLFERVIIMFYMRSLVLLKVFHQGNLTQNKVQSWGMIGTALTAIIGLITYLFKLFKGKDSDKMDKALELLEKQK